MNRPQWLHFFQRTYPSANMVLIADKHPLLVDSGFGSDLPETEQLLREAGVPPERLHLIVNTHYHGDHTGGNSGLQRRYGLPIAAHRWDAALINQRDWQACGAEWLNQPIEAYQVDRALSEGDEIDTGDRTFQVLHTPGHTLGHIALYEPREQVLICGDIVHSDDVAWLNVFREGTGVLQRAMDTLDKLAKLPIRQAYSGHGPAIDDPLTSINAARRRYEKWQGDPEKLGWHACKRIFIYALMLSEGMTIDEVRTYLLHSPWFYDYSRYIFRCKPADFVAPLLREVERSGAGYWHDGKLLPTMAYTIPAPNWSSGPTKPRDWPKIERKAVRYE